MVFGLGAACPLGLRQLPLELEISPACLRALGRGACFTPRHADGRSFARVFSSAVEYLGIALGKLGGTGHCAFPGWAQSNKVRRLTAKPAHGDLAMMAVSGRFPSTLIGPAWGN